MARNFKKLLKTALKVLAYISFALLFAGLILLWKFPYQALEKRIQKEVSQRTSCRMNRPKISFAFPFSIKVKELVLRPKNGKDSEFFQASNLILTLDPLALLKGAWGLSLKSSAYNGVLEGRLRSRSFSLPAQVSLNLSWQDLQVQRHPLSAKSLFFDLKGSLDGKLYYQGSTGGLRDISGKGKMVCAGLRATVKSSFLQFKEFKKLRLQGNYLLQKGSLQLEEVRLANSLLEGSLQGRVGLSPDLLESRLNLQGKVKLNPEAVDMGAAGSRMAILLRKQKPIPFSLSGTFNRVRFSLF